MGMTTKQILQGIKDWITNLFARQDGFYETMGVGTAVNLAGQTERTDDAMYRKSGGSEEVASGTATIANIKGNTVAWNQLVENGDFSDGKSKWLAHGVTMSASSNVLSIVAPATGQYAYQVVSTTKGHKYYSAYEVKTNNSSQVNFYNAGSNHTSATTTSWEKHNYITTQTTLDNDVSIVAGVADTIFVKNIILIDLTLIYGAGNEPTTPEQFEADYFKWFGKPLTYEEYDEGSLRSVQLDAMKTTGFNQWDEQWEKGYYNASGNPVSSTSQIRSKNLIKVIPDTEYYAKIGTSHRFCYYDANGVFISRSDLISGEIPLFTTPADCHYINFHTDYETTYNHDICINISDTAKNGTYEPYEEHVASIPVTTLKGKLNGQGESVTIFPDGMRSAGDVHDEIYTVGDKTYAVQRVGSVDMGTFGSIYQGTLYAPIANKKEATSNKIQIKNAKYSCMLPSPNPQAYNKAVFENSGSGATNRVWVRDTDCTDVASYQAALQGVMLYYELETPLVYEVDDFALPKTYLVDGGGTEEQVQKANVQGLAAILTCIYGVDAVGILDKLPQNYVAVNESQQFTELQKAQARNNIGAYSKPNGGIPVSDINLTNLPEIGIGYGICTTDTYEASKVVAIPNFLLIQEATINVLFTTPINTTDTTLNVNDTGAKTIKVLGNVLPSGIIKAQSIVTFVYYDNAWNITNVFTPDASFDPDALVVDMGLPSGVKWAARDIDLTKPSGFCDTPFVYEKSFFSWGNIDGHNPISNSAFDYNWGSVNAQEPYYEGQPYGSTPGNTLTGNIAVGEDFDAARANLGAPWRMPTRNEFVELFSNIIYINADGTEVDTTKADKRVTVNGIMGLYIQSTINGARLFFSCSGYGFGSSWYGRDSYGDYWSSTFDGSRNARRLFFYSGGVNPQDNFDRYYGFSVRAVQ